MHGRMHAMHASLVAYECAWANAGNRCTRRCAQVACLLYAQACTVVCLYEADGHGHGHEDEVGDGGGGRMRVHLLLRLSLHTVCLCGYVREYLLYTYLCVGLGCAYAHAYVDCHPYVCVLALMCIRRCTCAPLASPWVRGGVGAHRCCTCRRVGVHIMHMVM